MFYHYHSPSESVFSFSSSLQGLTRDPWMVQGIPRLPWSLISQHTYGQGRRLIPAARLLSYHFFLVSYCFKNICIHISIFIFCNLDTGIWL